MSPTALCPPPGPGASGPFLGVPPITTEESQPVVLKFSFQTTGLNSSLHRGPEAMVWQRCRAPLGCGAHLRPHTPTHRRCLHGNLQGTQPGHTQAWNPAPDRLPQQPPQLTVSRCSQGHWHGEEAGPPVSSPSPHLRSAALSGQTADASTRHTPAPATWIGPDPLPPPDSSLLQVRAQTPPPLRSPLWNLPEPSLWPTPSEDKDQRCSPLQTKHLMWKYLFCTLSTSPLHTFPQVLHRIAVLGGFSRGLCAAWGSDTAREGTRSHVKGATHARHSGAKQRQREALGAPPQLKPHSVSGDRHIFFPGGPDGNWVM